MHRITGCITKDTGMLIVTNLSGKVSQHQIKDGQPDKDLVLEAGHYNISFIPEDEKRQSSYAQYKIRVPECEQVDFSKIEIEQLV